MTCPTPHKIGYSDKTTALKAWRRMRQHGRSRGVSPYRCQCGDWHLGRDTGLGPRRRRNHDR